MQRGREAADDRGQQRDANGEEQYSAVQLDDGLAGKHVWNDGCGELDSTPGKKCAQCAASKSENQAFDKKLAYQPAAAGAQRSAKSNFAFAHGSASQQQVGHVAAGD